MTDKPTTRFAAVAARLQAAAAPVATTEKKTGLGRFRREAAEEQTDVAVRPDVENSALYKILVDASLDPKEKAEKIAELLYFNEEDLEANTKAVAENQAVVDHLLDNFTEHNKQMIRLARDNPLSELQTNLREVFENYHAMDTGRAELKDKLAVIDQILTQHGGPEGLVKALLNSKGKSEEKEKFDKELLELTERVQAVSGEVSGMDRDSLQLQRSIAEDESDSFLFFKAEKKRQIAENRKKLAEQEAEKAMKREALERVTAELGTKKTSYQEFMKDSDYQVHEQILKILDIGSPEFKQKLTELADATLAYIENTTDTLKGVGKQLGLLYDRAVDVHTLTQNTGESVSIVLDAQQRAQAHNALKLKEIEASETSTGVEGMKRERKLRAINEHVSGVEKTIQTTASVASELEKTQMQLSNMKDQMKSGLVDAKEHQLMAVGSAAVTGNATLMRIEGLATDVQSLVSRGQFMRETEYFLGDLAKEMERKLMGHQAKNEGIKTMGDAIREMAATMGEGNDLMLDIADNRKTLIDKLIKSTQDLGQANEQSLAVDGEINRRIIAGRTSGQPAPAPSGM